MRQTKPRRKPRNATTIAQSAPQPDDDDPVPKDIDEFRYAMARRIYKFIGDRERAWRDCPEACCRRARHCIAPSCKCVNLPPMPPMSEEESARAVAEFYRALRARCDEIDRENGAKGTGS